MGIPARPRVPRQTPAGPSTPQQAARKAGVQDSEERCKSAYWDCSLASRHPPATKQAPARRGMSQHAPACPGRPQQAAARPSRPQQAPARPNRPQQAARKAGVQDFEERCKSAYGDCSLAASNPPGGCPAGPPGQLWAAPGVPWAASRRLLAASGGVWRPKRVFYAPRSARVAIGAGKHGTWTSEEGPKRVFSRLRREAWPTAREKTHKGAPVVTP